MGTKNTEYKNSYNKDNYSRITLYFPKYEKESISDYCNAANIPVAEFVKSLVHEKIGDIIKDSVPREYHILEIYCLIPDYVMLFTCGSRWMISSPDKKGYLFGMRVSDDFSEQFKEYFAKKMPDEMSYNIWEKVFSSSNPEFKSGDDFDGDTDKLIARLNLKPEMVHKIYDNSIPPT